MNRTELWRKDDTLDSTWKRSIVYCMERTLLKECPVLSLCFSDFFSLFLVSSLALIKCLSQIPRFFKVDHSRSSVADITCSDKWEKLHSVITFWNEWRYVKHSAHKEVLKTKFSHSNNNTAGKPWVYPC